MSSDQLFVRHAVAGDAAVGRLQPDRSARGRRPADRAAGVAAERERKTPAAATAAAEPPLEPPGAKSGFQGFAVGGVTTPNASSWLFVLPINTAPASRNRATTVASVVAGSRSPS